MLSMLRISEERDLGSPSAAPCEIQGRTLTVPPWAHLGPPICILRPTTVARDARPELWDYS